MPLESEAQSRLMHGVANSPEFAKKVGIPQSVGEKFIRGDAEPRKAAGIMYVTDAGAVCLVRRGDEGDYAGHWSIPGGHIEADESAEDGARREFLEETGHNYKGELRQVYDDGHFTTFAGKGPQFDVKICDESTGHAWAKPDDTPKPLHPGLEIPFRVANASTELDVARLMAEGHLSSPQVYANMHLVALRITGTGLAYRAGLKEHVWRDPSLYLNPEFVARCAGLTVVLDHPPGKVLTSKEFKKRAVGSILHAYIRGEEVWGIAKIYDDEAMRIIGKDEISTSPSVVFDESSGNTIFKTESGEPLLIEGKPFLLDHIAVVTPERGSRGVWDKDEKPNGVELNNPEIAKMADETVKNDSAETIDSKIDKLFTVATGTLAHVKELTTRVDAMEKNMPAPPLQPITDKGKKADGSDAKGGEEEKPGDKEGSDGPKKKAVIADKKKADGDEEGKKEEKPKADAEGSHPTAEKVGEMKPDDDKEKDEEKAAAKADEQAALFSTHQAKADSVFAAFGKSASRPLSGETVLAYRKRLLKTLQPHSDQCKNINLRAVNDEAAFDMIERQIFHDALQAAKNPTARGDALIEVQERDRSGRTISTFRGSIEGFLGPFKVPPLRVTKFATAAELRDRV